MDPSTAQHQEMATQSSSSLESLLVSPKAQQERKPRPQPEAALKCPRCDSTNTKFCYYNNYSLTQPRYFCKSCRRYWTKGGTLRNVPVGGGCRKNKRSSSSSSSSSSNGIKRLQEQQPPLSLGADHFPTNPLSAFSTSLGYDHSHDLSLAFAGLHNKFMAPAGFSDHCDLSMFVNPNAVSSGQSTGGVGADVGTLGFLNAVRGGFLDTQPGVFHDPYYSGEMEIVGGGSENMAALPPYEQMSRATTTAVTMTTMKQEACSDAAKEAGVDPSRAMWGIPWQNIIGGDGSNMTGGELDAGRESWSGLTHPWHGLLNSPLM